MRSFDSLRGRREFTLAMRRGVAATASGITVHAYSPRGASTAQPKVGIIITKKVGKAVTRNRIRRRCKSLLHESLARTPARWYVIQCGPAAATMPFAELRRHLTDAMTRALRQRKASR